MAEIAYFYGWNFAYIKTMTMDEFDVAYKFMSDVRKRENKEAAHSGRRRR